MEVLRVPGSFLGRAYPYPSSRVSCTFGLLCREACQVTTSQMGFRCNGSSRDPPWPPEQLETIDTNAPGRVWGLPCVEFTDCGRNKSRSKSRLKSMSRSRFRSRSMPMRRGAVGARRARSCSHVEHDITANVHEQALVEDASATFRPCS